MTANPSKGLLAISVMVLSVYSEIFKPLFRNNKKTSQDFYN